MLDKERVHSRAAFLERCQARIRPHEPTLEEYALVVRHRGAEPQLVVGLCHRVRSGPRGGGRTTRASVRVLGVSGGPPSAQHDVVRADGLRGILPNECQMFVRTPRDLARVAVVAGDIGDQLVGDDLYIVSCRPEVLHLARLDLARPGQLRLLGVALAGLLGRALAAPILAGPPAGEHGQRERTRTDTTRELEPVVLEVSQQVRAPRHRREETQRDMSPCG